MLINGQKKNLFTAGERVGTNGGGGDHQLPPPTIRFEKQLVDKHSKQSSVRLRVINREDQIL